jgi:hypothetical protein
VAYIPDLVETGQTIGPWNICHPRIPVSLVVKYVGRPGALGRCRSEKLLQPINANVEVVGIMHRVYDDGHAEGSSPFSDYRDGDLERPIRDDAVHKL